MNMEKIIGIALRFLPQKYKAYSASVLLALSGLYYAGTEAGLYKDFIPPKIQNVILLFGAALGVTGLRHGQQKAEDAAKDAIGKAASLPAVDVDALRRMGL